MTCQCDAPAFTCSDAIYHKVYGRLQLRGAYRSFLHIHSILWSPPLPIFLLHPAGLLFLASVTTVINKRQSQFAGIIAIGDPGWADRHDEYLAEGYIDDHADVE